MSASRARMRSRAKSISDLAEPAQSSVVQLSTYFIYICAVLIGLFYDLVDSLLGRGSSSKSADDSDMPALVAGFDSFYSRHLYVRCLDSHPSIHVNSE